MHTVQTVFLYSRHCAGWGLHIPIHIHILHIHHTRHVTPRSLYIWFAPRAKSYGRNIEPGPNQWHTAASGYRNTRRQINSLDVGIFIYAVYNNLYLYLSIKYCANVLIEVNLNIMLNLFLIHLQAAFPIFIYYVLYTAQIRIFPRTEKME